MPVTYLEEFPPRSSRVLIYGRDDLPQPEHFHEFA